MYISFSDSLASVTLTQDNFFIPAGTDPLLIEEEQAGITFDPIVFGPETVSLPIPSELILPDSTSLLDPPDELI